MQISVPFSERKKKTPTDQRGILPGLLIIGPIFFSAALYMLLGVVVRRRSPPRRASKLKLPPADSASSHNHQLPPPENVQDPLHYRRHRFPRPPRRRRWARLLRHHPLGRALGGKSVHPPFPFPLLPPPPNSDCFVCVQYHVGRHRLSTPRNGPLRRLRPPLGRPLSIRTAQGRDQDTPPRLWHGALLAHDHCSRRKHPLPFPSLAPSLSRLTLPWLAAGLPHHRAFTRVPRRPRCEPAGVST